MKATTVNLDAVKVGAILRWTQGPGDDIDADEAAGDVGAEVYLFRQTWQVGSYPSRRVGRTLCGVSDVPLLTNMSHEPRMLGWLGTTNNVDADALGKVRVTGVQARRNKWGLTSYSYTARVIETD
jgi:hypothetical protein